MVNTHASEEVKLRAVRYFLKIKNYTRVCQAFGCSPRSLKRWVERYLKTGSVARKGSRKQPQQEETGG